MLKSEDLVDKNVQSENSVSDEEWCTVIKTPVCKFSKMFRRSRGISDKEIADRLHELEDDTDDDLDDVKVDPEPDSDDGIQVEEEAVFENEVNSF